MTNIAHNDCNFAKYLKARMKNIFKISTKEVINHLKHAELDNDQNDTSQISKIIH